MAFTRADFLNRRPYLYHYTHIENIDSLKSERQMLSAAMWVTRANEFRRQILEVPQFLETPRTQTRQLDVGENRTVILNDQAPLKRNQCTRIEGTFEDFVRCLNGYVFFWPGCGNPNPSGRAATRFAERYSGYALLLLPIEPLWPDAKANIRFCQYNSGAPQKRSNTPRGPQIFVSCGEATYDVQKVVEVVFPNQIQLPAKTEWLRPGETRFRPLFQ